jgi:hypothetical protein
MFNEQAQCTTRINSIYILFSAICFAAAFPQRPSHIPFRFAAMSSGDSWINRECQTCLGNFSYNLDFSRRYNDNNAKAAELLLLVIQWAVLPCLAAFYLRYHIWSAKGLDAQAKHCLLCNPPHPPPPPHPPTSHPLCMFLATGSCFSALDWTLWWLYKYQPLPDPQAVLICVYWFKPLGYTGFVCAKGLCVYRVLTSPPSGSAPHPASCVTHTLEESHAVAAGSASAPATRGTVSSVA